MKTCSSGTSTSSKSTTASWPPYRALPWSSSQPARVVGSAPGGVQLERGVVQRRERVQPDAALEARAGGTPEEPLQLDLLHEIVRRLEQVREAAHRGVDPARVGDRDGAVLRVAR